MIIWGSKAKESQIASGRFFCPNCMTDTGYSHMRVSRYFTLYFIPLFPTSTLGEYVRCHGCQGDMVPHVVQFTREQILESLQPWACAQCGNRNPRSTTQCLGCGASQQSQQALPPAPQQALPQPSPAGQSQPPPLPGNPFAPRE